MPNFAKPRQRNNIVRHNNKYDTVLQLSMCDPYKVVKPLHPTDEYAQLVLPGPRQYSGPLDQKTC